MKLSRSYPYLLFVVLAFSSCRNDPPPQSRNIEDKESSDLVRFEHYFRFPLRFHENWSISATVRHEKTGMESDYELRLVRSRDTTMQSQPGPEFHEFEIIEGYQVLEGDTSDVRYVTLGESLAINQKFSLCELDTPRWLKNCKSLYLPSSTLDGKVPKEQTRRFSQRHYLTFKDTLGRRIVWGASLVPDMLYPRDYVPVAVKKYTYSVWGETLNLK